MGQPDFMAGADFRRDGCKFQRQFLDQGLADRGFELGRQLVAADQARTVQPDIEIAEDISRLQAARPVFKRIEMPRGIGAANDRADRGADHDVGHDTVGNQGPDDADMGESARCAAAQREPDDWPPDAPETHLVAVVLAVLAAPDQYIQHLITPGSTRLCTTARSRQIVPQAWFMPQRRRGAGRDCDWTATRPDSIGSFLPFR